ncbi:pseudouridine synthase [Flavicella sp.]|uniref:pseudouridine synthase n=1 Tax=Flavicella sp. TaxID=2957742 RepID=UPI00301A441B
MQDQHFIIHKPYGFISQFVNNKTRKKKLLGDLYNFPVGTMSIGRLDAKSEGLLLLTTNGMLSHTICSSKVEKEYYVQLDGIIDQESIDRLNIGVEIGFNGIKYMTKPCVTVLLATAPSFKARSTKIRDARHGPTSWISVAIREGKFRQVRKMTSAVGFPTLRLVRVRIGEIKLNDLKSGEVIPVDCLEY